jgi:hypothetical protein
MMWIVSAWFVVSVSRQGPAAWRVVDEQAEGVIGVFGGEVDLGANATGHPHHARLATHAYTLAIAQGETTVASGAEMAIAGAAAPRRRIVALSGSGRAARTSCARIRIHAWLSQKTVCGRLSPITRSTWCEAR